MLISNDLYRYSGRVKTVFVDNCDIPIELGAELLHGKNTVLGQIVEEIGLEIKEVFTWAHGDGGPHPDHHVNGTAGYYYDGKNLLRFDQITQEHKHLNQLLQEMELDDLDETVHDYLVRNGVSESMIEMASAGYNSLFYENSL